MAKIVPNFANNDGGRPKGSKNKFTNLKNAFLEAFYSEELGGTQGLIDWANKNNENKTHFYKFIVALLPKDLKVTGSGDTPIATKVEIYVQDGNVDPDLDDDDQTYDLELDNKGVEQIAHDVIDPALKQAN